METQTPILPSPPFPTVAGSSPSPSHSATPLRWLLVDVLKADGSEENLKRWSSFIGICIAISGNALISLALNVQKYAHMRIKREAARRYREHQHLQNGGLLPPPSPSAGLKPDGCGPQLHHHRRSSSLGESSTAAAPLLSSHDHDLDEPVSPRTAMTPLLAPEKDHHDEGNYIASPYWWAGIVLMSIGEAGNFLAYGFAPASIISPLGVVALIANCVIAPLLLKEPFRYWDALGVAVSIAGAVTVVWSAEKEETQLGPDEILSAISQLAFQIYVAVTLALIVTLGTLSGRYGHRTIIIDLSLAALLGGYTVLSTKAISSLISSSFYRIFTYPIAYAFAFVLVSTAIAQVRYVNRALQRFESTQVIPTQFVLFTISVIVGSAILYGDFRSVDGERLARFCTGCALTFAGVWLISSHRGETRSTEGEGDDLAESTGGERGLETSPQLLPRSRGTDELSRSGSESQQGQSRGRGPLGIVPGVMTGYQLGGALAERVGGSLRGVVGQDGAESGGEEREGAGHKRRGSLSVVLGLMKMQKNHGARRASAGGESEVGGAGEGGRGGQGGG